MEKQGEARDHCTVLELVSQQLVTTFFVNVGFLLQGLCMLT